MDTKLRKNKNILAFIMCFCIAVITFNLSNIGYYVQYFTKDFTEDFYKSSNMEEMIYAIALNSVYTVLGDSASEQKLKERELARETINDYKGAEIFVVDNDSKRTYSNKMITTLDDFIEQTKYYPYFVKINFESNTVDLLINNKKTDFISNDYKNIGTKIKEDVTTYIAIPSIEKIKQGKDDIVYLRYRQYVGMIKETTVFIGSKIILGIVLLVVLVLYIIKSKKNKKSNELSGNNINKKNKSWSLEETLLILIFLILTTYYGRFGFLYVPLATLLLFQVYHIIKFLKNLKGIEDLFDKSIVFKQISRDTIKLENKTLVMKSIILLIGFTIIQVSIIAILYSTYIDYSSILPNMIYDLIFNIVGIQDTFLNILIGLIICNLIAGIFIIKKVNKLAEINFGVRELRKGNLDYKIEISEDDLFKELVTHINSLGDAINIAVEDRLKSEKMKTELITNVSHDLKTPLTAMINYISLLKKEDIKPEHVKDYITVLDTRSQRLKVLIDDLFEASKINSGDIELSLEKTDINQLLMQSIVEMEDFIEEAKLNFIINIQEKEVYIMLDGRKTWRVFENIISNIVKYSLAGTRVYIDIIEKNGKVNIVMKNISSYPLNFNAEEITERFTRGDISRNTEGSGLGLSIAKGFVESQGGSMDIDILGDLFIMNISFGIIR